MATQEYQNGTVNNHRLSDDEHKVDKDAIEAAISEIEVPFRLTFKLLQALGALFGLLAISVLPVFVIGGSACNSPS